MVLTVLTKSSKSLTFFGMLLLFSLSPASFSAELGGGIRVGASHTDNVFLAPAGSEIDDITYQASPFLSFLYESPQLDASADYTFDWFRYADLGATSKFHRGEASLTAKLLKETLSTVIGIRRSQTLENPQDVIPSGRLPLSGNLIDQDEWWFNPHLSRKLGSVVSVNADYRFTKLQFKQGAVQDNDNQAGNLAFDNYSAGSGLTWALRYDWRRTEYEVTTPWEFQQATAELGFWANTSMRFFGSGGKETAWDNPIDPSLDDSFWEAGVAYSPNDKLSAEFAAGERGFGSSFRGNLSYTFRRGSTSITYDETPTTTGFNRSRGFTSGLAPDQLGDFLDRPGSAERFLSKAFRWNLDIAFRRTALNFSIFDEDRSGRISTDGVPSADQSQTGVSASFSWQAGARTKLAVTGSIVDRETDANEESQFIAAGVSVDYRLGSKTSLSLGYNYSEQEPGGLGGFGRDYKANVVSLFFTYTM